MKALALALMLVAQQPAPQLPRRAPALALKDLRGRVVRLSDYGGKIVLLNFWATWCVPCRAEAPDLVRLQRDYGGKGLRVIGVSYPPNSRRAVRRFAREFEINYPLLNGTRAAKALFTKSETLPMTIVIDREGRVREIVEGILLPEEFDEKIKPLLEGAAPSEQASPQVSKFLPRRIRYRVD
jgi:thiol-disulfide isomerase/thioredoxin